MNQTEDMAGVMRRIAKLLAIAQDSRGDANECAAAARMAESVMRKYQIEHADVLMTELNKGDAESFADEDVGSSLNPDGRSSEASGWAGILAVHVAKLHDCQARFVRTLKYGKTLRFSGFAVDAQVARATYHYLVTQMKHATKQWASQQYGASRAVTEAFRRGYCASLGASLKSALEAKQREMQEASSSRALVIVKADAVAKHFGTVRYSKAGSYRTSQGDAYSSGREEGRKVDVTRRSVGNSSSAIQLK